MAYQLSPIRGSDTSIYNAMSKRAGIPPMPSLFGKPNQYSPTRPSSNRPVSKTESESQLILAALIDRLNKLGKR
jgi:hypothetical protein